MTLSQSCTFYQCYPRKVKNSLASYWLLITSRGGGMHGDQEILKETFQTQQKTSYVPK